jgi:lysozyme
MSKNSTKNNSICTYCNEDMPTSALICRACGKYKSQNKNRLIYFSNISGMIAMLVAGATAGVDFAYIKATEGGDFTDRYFARNWQQAAEAGVPRGAYHFFTLCRSGNEQAAHAIATIPKDAAALPLAVDLEFGGNCSGRPDKAALHRELSDFLRRVESHFGRPVILYLVRDFDMHYAISQNFPRKLWYRSLYFPPEKLPQPLAVWQYHNWTRVNGIDGPVDWNAAKERW